MKHLILAAVITLALHGSGWTAEKRSEVKALALNNFHQEMVNCLIYYGIAEEGIRKSGNKKTAAKYREIIELLYKKTLVLTQAIGMKEEALDARMQLSTDTQLAAIDGDYINISILMNKYMEPCTAVINDPFSRIDFWMRKAQQK